MFQASGYTVNFDEVSIHNAGNVSVLRNEFKTLLDVVLSGYQLSRPPLNVQNSTKLSTTVSCLRVQWQIFTVWRPLSVILVKRLWIIKTVFNISILILQSVPIAKTSAHIRSCYISIETSAATHLQLLDRSWAGLPRLFQMAWAGVTRHRDAGSWIVW